MAVVKIELEVDPKSGESKIKLVGTHLDELENKGKKTKDALSGMMDGLQVGAGVAIMERLFKTFENGIGWITGAIRAQDAYVTGILKATAATDLNARSQAILMRAGADADVAFEKQLVGLGKLAKVLEDQPEKLGRIGLSYQNLKGLAPEEQFEKVGQAIAGIEDPMKRLAVAQEFFGKSGAELIPLFTGAIGAAREAVDGLGLSISDLDAQNIDSLNNSLDLLNEVGGMVIRRFVALVSSAESVHVFVDGLTKVVADLSKAFFDNEAAGRSMVDNGVVLISKALITMVEAVQIAIDVWDSLKITGLSLYKILLDIGIALLTIPAALSGKSDDPIGRYLRENLALLKAEKAGLVASTQELLDSNTKKTNAISQVRAELAKLETAVGAAAGKTRASAEDDTKKTGTLLGLSEGAKKAAAAFEKQIDVLDKWTEAEAKASDAAEKGRKAREMAGVANWIEKEAEASKAASAIRHKAFEQMIKDTDEWMEAEARASAQADQAREYNRAVRFNAIFDGIANVADQINPKLGTTVDIVRDMAAAWLEAKNGADKFYAVAAAVGALGNVIGGKTGSTMSGAAGGAMSGFAVGGPIGAAIGGLIGGLAGFFGGKKKEKEQRAQVESGAVDALSGLLDRLNAFKADQLEKGVAGVNAQFAYLASKTDVSAERLARMGSIGLGMFASLRAQGLSMVDAMAKMGPMFDDAIKVGADKFGAHFAEIAAFRQKILDNQELVTAAESLGDVIDSLRTFGKLTAETFGDVVAENSALIDDMLAKGFSLDEALNVNAKSLYAIYRAQKDLGLAVDETTQKYLDQAEKAGLFENMKDPMEELVEIQKIQLQIMAELVKVFGGSLPESVRAYLAELDKIPAKKTTEVETRYTRTGDSGEGGGDGRGDDAGGPQNYAGSLGLRDYGMGTRTTLHGEEAVLTRAQINNLIRGAAGSAPRGSSAATYNVHVSVPEGTTDPEVFGRRVAAAFVDGLKKNTVGVREEIAAYVPMG